MHVTVITCITCQSHSITCPIPQHVMVVITCITRPITCIPDGQGVDCQHDERCQAEAPGRQGRLAPQGSLLKCLSLFQSLSLISCSHDCPILLSVAIRGQPSGPAGRPITVVPLKPKAGLAKPGPGRALPTDRWTPSRANATGRPTEKQPPPHRGPTPESSGPHVRTRQPG